MDHTLSFTDIEQAFSRAARWPADLPALLFHYTSAEALLGIVETGSLWASQIRYLNDTAELVYAAELIDEVLRERASACPELLRAAAGEACRILADAEQEKSFYAASFSEEGDLLSQWRAYGDAGGGYAVGIRMGEVRHLVSSPIVRRVEYEKAEQQARIEEMLTSAEPRGSGGPDEEEVRALVADLVLAGAFFKHDSFREEREWRALCVADQDDPAIEFRAAAGIIVPFVPIPLLREEQAGEPGAPPRVPIGRVVCGPTLQPTLSRRAVELLLRLRGFERFEVGISRVPLRPRGF